MTFSLFDLHADTPSELYGRKQALRSNELHVALDKAEAFRRYCQVMAVWSNCRLSDEEAWDRFWQIRENLLSELSENRMPLFTDGAALREALSTEGRGAILAVEDARILAGDLTRLDRLYEAGVRFLTLTWAGETCIGGSHDTEAPLTPFGRSVVERCFLLGITPDVSHASRKVTKEVIGMARAAHRPLVATHSNAFSVWEHTRNLTDAEFVDIAECGGVVGVSLCTPHLAKDNCTIQTVVSHIRHYLDLGGENTLCLGCDFDGIDETPEGLTDLSRMPALFDALLHEGIPATTVQKLFFENAYGFAAAHI